MSPFSQVMEFAACDRPTARKLLKQNSNDVNAAVSAYFNNPGAVTEESRAIVPFLDDVNKGHDQDQHTGWTPPPTSGPRTFGPHLPDRPRQDKWTNQEVTSAAGGEGNADRTSKKRNTPVDLTADDEDDDFKRAMQASLESETTRQKRQQDYVYQTRSSGRTGNEDDEALSRAIEASMQQSTTVTRSHTPQSFNQDLEALGAYRLRQPEQPVAIVPPVPFMRLFALSMQAIFAAKPLRKSLMSIQMSDLRLNGRSNVSMSDYWHGNSPNGIKFLGEQEWNALNIAATDEEKEAMEATMRLVTLFVFLEYTKRPLCVADDVISHPVKSNYAYVMNSSRRPASDIVSCYMQATFDTISLAVDFINKQQGTNAEDCREQLRSATISCTAMAVTPQSDDPRHPRKPKDPYEQTVFQLIHNNVNTTVHKALYAHLADDKALLTSTASTLLLGLGRLGPSNSTFGFGAETGSTEKLVPFEVESRLYLDQFLFEKRNGIRLGLDSAKVKGHLTKIEELEKHRKAIGWHEGTDSRVLLRGSLDYLSKLCDSTGADQIRLDSINEAVPRLELMLGLLEQEITEVDHQISEEKKAVDDERNSVMSGFLNGLEDPQLQTIRYDLQAVMMNDDQTAWAYVKHDARARDQTALPSTWWKICDGQVEQVTEADVLGDRNEVHFLIYTRYERSDGQDEIGRNGVRVEQQVVSTEYKSPVEETEEEEEGGSKPHKTLRLDSVLDWWTNTPLVECIEADNAAFGAYLTQQIRSEHEQTSVESLKMDESDSTLTNQIDMTATRAKEESQ